eukprot:GHVR01045304.1.p1 GENE.GHVR01045304.1~~GHVR01045304.1.p1  ORF type:complete len:155 (+),score=33.99 GHVR01045304.1:112-576(+)
MLFFWLPDKIRYVLLAHLRNQSEIATIFWRAVSESLSLAVSGTGLHTRIATLAQAAEVTGATLSQAGATLKESSLAATSLNGSSEDVLVGCRTVVGLVVALHKTVTAAIATTGSAVSHVSEIMDGLKTSQQPLITTGGTHPPECNSDGAHIEGK